MITVVCTSKRLDPTWRFGVHWLALVCAQGLHHDHCVSERAGAVFKINHGRVIAADCHDLCGNRAETFDPATVQPGTPAELLFDRKVFHDMAAIET